MSKLLRVYSLLTALLLLNTLLIAQDDKSLNNYLDSLHVQQDTVVASPDSEFLDYEEEQGLKDTANNESRPEEPPLLRSVPQSLVDSLKATKDFEYANDPAYWKDDQVKDEADFWKKLFGFLRQQWVRYLFYVLLGALLLFVLYKIIVENQLFLFYSSPKKKSGELLLETELMQEDMEGRILEAESKEQYREATRYRFLRVLQQLNNRNLITYDAQLTNADYLRQMKQHPSIKELKMLIRVYEYVWYGEFEPDAGQYASIKEMFTGYLDKIQ